ncbi:MAG: DNA-directed RNA polymerase subunit A'', partial [Euryarchaeota archaeon]|nr:DNA-directed RNA polymerase subunit A'' [Euryarchaeota archaeon]
VDVKIEGSNIILNPSVRRYRTLLQIVEKVRAMTIKGIDDIKRVVVRKERDEYVLYTEGSSLKKTIQLDHIDATRTKTNNINEMAEAFGIEAARNSIIEEAMDTLREQGLTVDVRHIMLVADMMTIDGEVKQIGRHGIAGEKTSVLSRAAFEVTVNHLLDAAIRGETDELAGVTENVIVGQPILLGTGDVRLIARRSTS